MWARLRMLTAGESHGPALLGILEGLPAGLSVDLEQVQADMARRQWGYGRGRRMAIETDEVQILGGVRHGRTLGSPIGLLIENRDFANWRTRMAPIPEEGAKATRRITIPRPGHADLAGLQKHGGNDVRDVLERASARETAMRTALGAFCRQFLRAAGIEVVSHVVALGTLQTSYYREEAGAVLQRWDAHEVRRRGDAASLRCLDEEANAAMEAAVADAREEGDTLGGVFEVLATGVPPGLGSWAHWDRKLSARLAEAILGINALRGVELGLGFRAAARPGSEVHDPIAWSGEQLTRPTNRAGGIEGGTTNGQPLVLRAAMKPIPTLRKALPSVNLETRQPAPAHKERSDVCAVPAAAVVAEAMVCLVLSDALLERFGGDTLDQFRAHLALSPVVP